MKPRHWVNFNFQRNVIPKMTLMKVEDQRCFNADLKLLFARKEQTPSQWPNIEITFEAEIELEILQGRREDILVTYESNVFVRLLHEVVIYVITFFISSVPTTCNRSTLDVVKASRRPFSVSWVDWNLIKYKKHMNHFRLLIKMGLTK